MPPDFSCESEIFDAMGEPSVREQGPPPSSQEAELSFMAVVGQSKRARFWSGIALLVFYTLSCSTQVRVGLMYQWRWNAHGGEARL
jgi:hypothetical protein